MKDEMTIQDEFSLEGAVVILARYAQHLRQNVDKVVSNYEATDFDREQFLADVAYAISNADVLKTAAKTITAVLMKMRAEVAEIFKKEVEV